MSTSPGFTLFRMKRPDTSVIAPRVSPLTVTIAPGRGRSVSSTTVPVMSKLCAPATPGNKVAQSVRPISRTRVFRIRFLIYLLLVCFKQCFYASKHGSVRRLGYPYQAADVVSQAVFHKRKRLGYLPCEEQIPDSQLFEYRVNGFA